MLVFNSCEREVIIFTIVCVVALVDRVGHVNALLVLADLRASFASNFLALAQKILRHDLLHPGFQLVDLHLAILDLYVFLVDQKFQILPLILKLPHRMLPLVLSLISFLFAFDDIIM